MSLNAAALRVLAAKGLTLEDAAELAEAMEPTPTSSAARQKRYRDRKRNERDVTRDVTPAPYEDTSTPSEELKDEANASSQSRQPVAVAKDVWNENAAPAGWPTINTMSAGRSRGTSARLREHGLEGWRAAIARARASPYLGGTDPPSWFTFDWLIKSANFLKVTEGNYDRRNDANRGSAQRMGGPGPSSTLAMLRAANGAIARDREDRSGAGPALPAQEHG